VESYDIVMLVVLVGAAIFGAVKGFAWQLASIASIVVSYVVAYRFREPFSESIQADPPWNRFLAMLILFVGTSLVVWVAFRMVSGTIDRLKLREFDRQVGAVFGLIKGTLYCTLMTLFGVTLLGDDSREKIVSSQSGRYIARVLDHSESVIPPEIHEVVRPYLDRFDHEFDGRPESAAGPDRWIAGTSGQESAGRPANFDRPPDGYWDPAGGTAASPPLPVDRPSWSRPSGGFPQQARQPTYRPSPVGRVQR
jgi:membrane protein required for colicin V production